jgi:3-phenylpropionate/trans-cinnamate dioxygenase ferredoxin subunit
VAVPVPFPALGRSSGFEVEGRGLLLCNGDGAPYVIENVCPHTAVSLAGGVLQGTVLECPHHGGRLDVRDGRPVRLPIRRSVACYPVRAAGAGLEVGLPALGGVPSAALQPGD